MSNRSNVVTDREKNMAYGYGELLFAAGARV